MPDKRRSATQDEQAGPEDMNADPRKERSGRGQHADSPREGGQRDDDRARGAQRNGDDQAAVHERIGSRAAEQELDAGDDRRAVRRRDRAGGPDDGQQAPPEGSQEEASGDEGGTANGPTV